MAIDDVEDLQADRRDNFRRTQGEVALWSAVVHQAYVDLMDAPLGSFPHKDAVAFCTSGGTWRESRINIADMIGINADDIERGGRKVMAARIAQTKANKDNG